MADVAARAGVSHQTVSRVVNDHPSVAPATRERVQRAIAELGYRPNVVARYLAQRRSETIGVITVGDSPFSPTSSLLAIGEAARKSGYFIGFAPIRSIDLPAVRQVLDHYIGLSVAGLIVVAPQAGLARAVMAARPSCPTVIIAHGITVDDVNQRHLPGASGEPIRLDPSRVPVSGTDLLGMSSSGRGTRGPIITTAIDQFGGAVKVMNHLIDLGRTDIAYVAGAPGWLDNEGREAGWRHALASQGLRQRPVVGDDWNAASGYAAVMSMADDLPEAIFCANDHSAIGALRALRELGVRVPDDVAVAGFDNIPGADMLFPPLTTVEQNFAVLGEHAMDLLTAAIGGAPHTAPLVDPPLLIRESTAGAAFEKAQRP